MTTTIIHWRCEKCGESHAESRTLDTTAGGCILAPLVCKCSAGAPFVHSPARNPSRLEPLARWLQALTGAEGVLLSLVGGPLSGFVMVARDPRMVLAMSIAARVVADDLERKVRSGAGVVS